MSQAVEHLIGNNLVDGICLMPFVDANKYITKSQLEIFPCPNSKIKYYYGAEVKNHLVSKLILTLFF